MEKSAQSVSLAKPDYDPAPDIFAAWTEEDERSLADLSEELNESMLSVPIGVWGFQAAEDA